jgi:hypothetical protein
VNKLIGPIKDRIFNGVMLIYYIIYLSYRVTINYQLFLSIKFSNFIAMPEGWGRRCLNFFFNNISFYKITKQTTLKSHKNNKKT